VKKGNPILYCCASLLLLVVVIVLGILYIKSLDEKSPFCKNFAFLNCADGGGDAGTPTP